MRSMRVLCFITLVVLIVFAGSVISEEQDSLNNAINETTISFATGPQKSVYEEIGLVASGLNDKFDVEINAITTNGSWQNLNMLDSQQVQFALTQQDALVEFLRRHPNSKIQIIKPIFEEYLHIMLRSQFNIPRASQFRDLRIFTGLSQSGTALTTLNLFNTLGISTGQYDPIKRDSLNEIKSLFREESLDVATYVDGLGNSGVSELMSSRVAHFFSLDHETRKLITIDRAHDIGSGIYIREIPPNTYDNQPRGVQAITVPVLLVTTSEIDTVVTEKVIAAIDSAMLKLDDESYGGLFTNFVPKQTLENFPLYQNGEHLPPMPGFFTFLNIVIICGIIFMIYLAIRYRIRLFRFFRSHPGRGAAIIAILLSMVCAYGAYLSENKINANFSDFYESYYSVIIYIISGMENRIPVTGMGRIFCLASLVLGPFMIAMITGFFASSLIIHFMEAGMPKQLSDHFVIANWNSRALAVIEDLRSPILDHSVIAVVSDDPSVDFKELNRQFMKQRSRGFEDVYFCPGDPSTKLALLNANVERSDAIIILADDREQTSDEKTIRTVFVLKEIGEEKKLDLDVVVELRNVENIKIIQEMRNSFPGTLDYVASSNIRTMLLAQCALNKGLSDVYRQLLTPTEDTCELYTVEIPDSVIGGCFRDYRVACTKIRTKEGVIPLGIGRRINGKLEFEINPLPLLHNKEENPFHTLQKGDELLVIAYDPPKTSDLPNSLEKYDKEVKI